MRLRAVGSRCLDDGHAQRRLEGEGGEFLAQKEPATAAVHPQASLQVVSQEREASACT